MNICEVNDDLLNVLMLSFVQAHLWLWIGYFCCIWVKWWFFYWM